MVMRSALYGALFVASAQGFQPTASFHGRLVAPQMSALDKSASRLTAAVPSTALAKRDVSLKASTASEADKPKTNLVVLGAYFLAWYALNVGYNIANKQVLNVFPCYGTVAVAQLLVAWVWLLPQFALGLRAVPKPP